MRYFRNLLTKRSNSLKNWRNWKWRTIMAWILRLGALVITAITIVFALVAVDLPNPNKLIQRSVPESTTIYARDGTTVLYQINGQYNRTLIPFDQMNDYVKNSTIAVEDKNFYHEGGIDFKSIFRAVFVDLLHGGSVQGASTITQQFIKNAALTDQKSLTRKAKEAILAIEMNELYSKNDILKLYLNEIPYGRNAYGIQAAAQSYFGIDAKNLDLAQAAYLAAMIQAPSHYNPFGPYRQQLDARKNTVLTLMMQQGYITQQQLDSAEREKVTFLTSHTNIVAPHFVFYIEDYLAQKYGQTTLENGGLKVVTTLDPKLQSIAQNVVDADMPKIIKQDNGNNAALVAIDPNTGQILAMIGSRDYFGTPTPPGCTPGVNCNFDPTVNVALAQRQPGSSAKPYVYVTAFSQPFDQAPASLRMDVPTDFGTYGGKDYIPQDYSGHTIGPVSIRKALDGSLNIPAVKTLDLVGVDNAVQTMHNFGITSPLQNCGLSLVLGGCEVTLLDHVSGYSTFATEGIHHQTTGILSVADSNGNVLEQFQDKSSRVVDAQAAYEIDNVLSDNNARTFVFGAHSPLILPDRPVAAKTGTTQNFRDGWTLGFTPSLAAGVWVGNNDGSLLRNGADGVVVAGPIWHDFMQQATAGTPVEQFPVPAGIQTITVDQDSGLLPTQYSGPLVQEVFASYAVPTKYDNVHVMTIGPSGQPEVCAYFQSEQPDNPNWQDPVLAYDYATGCTGGTLPPEAGGGTTGGTAGGNGGQTGSPGTGGNPPSSAQQNPPTIEITYPSNGATVTQPINLQATITADTGASITRVDFLVDGSIVQSLNSGPFEFSVPPLTPGSHTLALHAVDSNNNTSDNSITIKIK